MVYLSGSGRDTSAEEEFDVYVRAVEKTGAKAVKFKIGGRMSDNRDAAPGRTDKILELAQKNLAGKVTLMADANGSYDASTPADFFNVLPIRSKRLCSTYATGHQNSRPASL